MAAEQEYQVVARRYRPQSFHELVGQEHIAKALANAIQNQRIGHAYLFTGARGVGKTSSARIFAKSLNCITGPTPMPCGKCEICEGIAAGEDLDVIEIDGASNRGIDQIRTLIQSVSVRPVRARFKIFIIDEVHMLTNEAFNALLKTLEEPPEHVKFIFCTTEVNKIPITILSRCQRFDFAGIGTQAIAGRLQSIVENEGLTAEPEAIRLLARRANGSMRDGQSLLEQLLAFTSGTLTLQDVHQLLGTAKDEVLIEILRSIVRNDPAAILRTLDVMFQQGTDPGQLVEQLFGCLRDMMAIVAGCGGESFLFLPMDIEDEVREMAQKMGLDLILAAMQIADHTLTRMKVSTQGRLLAEMAFVRICALQNLADLASLVKQAGAQTAGHSASASDVSGKSPALSGVGPDRNSVSPHSAGRLELPTKAFPPHFVPEKVALAPPQEIRRSFMDEMAGAGPAKKKVPGLNESGSSDAPSGTISGDGGRGPAVSAVGTGKVRPSGETFGQDPAERVENISGDGVSGDSVRHAFSGSEAVSVPPASQTTAQIVVPPASQTLAQADVSPASQTPIRSSASVPVPDWDASGDDFSMPDDVFQTIRTPEMESAEKFGNARSASLPGTAKAGGERSAGLQTADAAEIWNRYLAAVDRMTGSSGFQTSNLKELKDVNVSEDGRVLTIYYPQRTEFVLQPFLHGGVELKQLEEAVRQEFGDPRLQLRLVVEEFAGKPHTENGGLKHIYANPLVHAAEEFFGASIEKIETVREALPETAKSPEPQTEPPAP
ncbi:MAG: DNA polymerase III subunit gamma/tau [Thermoguttaceae bacterium]|nr:DNA polymerase III subunit gamma/tau [Thermoguttaceae bacterium]